MKDKIEKLSLIEKMLRENKENSPLLTISKKKTVKDWAEILRQIAWLISSDDNLTQEEKLEMADHFWASGEAIKALCDDSLEEVLKKLCSMIKEQEKPSDGEA